MTLAGPSVSDAEAEAVAEAGKLDLGVSNVGTASPNLEAGMTRGFDELETCRE